MKISTAMKDLISRLQSDWSFIEDFLNNPKETLMGFQLTLEEKRALMTRDPQSLYKLGFDANTVVELLSGKHSTSHAVA